jgi:uncharacterized protein (DUF2345 family)
MAISKPAPCCRRQNAGGQEQLVVETAGGQRITLQDAPPSILLEDSSGNSIRLQNGQVSITTPGRLVIQAAIVEINGGELLVNAGMAKFSGTLQSDTVITNSVVASSYTPGAGNIW